MTGRWDMQLLAAEPNGPRRMGANSYTWRLAKYLNNHDYSGPKWPRRMGEK